MQLEVDEAVIYAAECAARDNIPIFIDAGPANRYFLTDCRRLVFA